MCNKPDLYDWTEPERDEVESVLRGIHHPSIRLAREMMAAPPKRLDPVQEQALEDALGDLGHVTRFLEAALKRSWGG
jgi:hypothetical protein